MWDKLTAADIEHINDGLATRRSKMLARHAEELKAMEAKQTEIDNIEQAIIEGSVLQRGRSFPFWGNGSGFYGAMLRITLRVSCAKS